jgi:hypothetical protein
MAKQNKFFIVVGIFLACCVSGFSTDRTWTGLGGNGNWSNGANWEGGVAPIDLDRLIFNGTTRQSNSNNYLTSVSAIVFNNGGFTVGLGPGPSTNLSILSSISCTGNNTIKNYISGAMFTVPDGGIPVDVAAGSTLTVDGAGWNIAGTITKTGPGILSFINYKQSYSSASLDVDSQGGVVGFDSGYWWQSAPTDAMRLKASNGGTLRIGNAAFAFLVWTEQGALDQLIIETNSAAIASGNLCIRSGTYGSEGRIVLHGGTLTNNWVECMYEYTVQSKAAEISSYINSRLNINGNSSGKTITVNIEDGPAEFDCYINNGVSGNSTTFTKTGAGSLVATAGSFDYLMNILNGTMFINYTMPAGSGGLNINGGSIGGTGTIYKAITYGASGGDISPGCKTGTLNIIGNLNLTSSGSPKFFLYITNSVDYGQLRVSGNINLANAELVTDMSYEPKGDEKWFIIVNDGANPVTGTFKNLPQNGLLVTNGFRMTISYVGDYATRSTVGGNDVVISAHPIGTVLYLK